MYYVFIASGDMIYNQGTVQPVRARKDMLQKVKKNNISATKDYILNTRIEYFEMWKCA